MKIYYQNKFSVEKILFSGEKTDFFINAPLFFTKKACRTVFVAADLRFLGLFGV